MADERLRLANDVANIGVWDWDLQNNCLEWDERMSEWYGLTGEERQAGCAYERWWSSVHPDDVESAEARLQEALRTGHYDDSFRICRPDGSQRTIHAAGIVLYDDQHQPERMVGINQDITQQREQWVALAEAQAQLARAKNENRLGALIDQSLIGIAELDADGRLTRVNDCFAGMLGYTREELQGQTVQDITDPRDWADTEAHLHALRLRGQSFMQEKRYRRKSGTFVWGKVLAMPVVDPQTQATGVLAVIIDIDAAKQAGQSLRLALEASQIGMYDWDIVNGHILWTPEHERHWGYRPGEFDGSYQGFAHRVHPDDLAEVNATIESAKTARQPYRHAFRVVWPDGSVHWMNVRGEFEYDSAGHALHMRGTVLDITDSVIREAELREQKDRLDEAQRIARIGNWEHTLDGHITWSPEVYRQLGVERGIFKPTKAALVGLIHPEDRASLRDWLSQLRGGLRPEPLTLRRYRPDGHLCYLRLQGELQHDSQGQPVRKVGTLQDVTEIQQATELLRQSRQQLTLAMEAGGLGACHWDLASNRIQGINLFRPFFGLPEAPAYDYGALMERVHPDDRARVDGALQRAITAGVEFAEEYRLLHPDGTLIWVTNRAQIMISADGKNRSLDGILVDITKRKQAEAQLQQSESRLLLATDSGQIGTWYWDIVNDTIDLSARGEQHLAKSPGIPFTFPYFLSVLHPDDRDTTQQTVQAALRDHHDYTCAYRVVQPDGGYRWIQAAGHAIYDEAGSPIGMMGVTQDITERKQTEAALYESTERLRLFIERAPAALAMFDRDMRYIAASQRWKDDYGLGDRDIIGLNHYELFPDLPEHLRAAHRRGLAGETLRVEEDCIEWADGRVQWVRWELLPWRQQDGAVGGILISAEDITERRQVFENLRDSEQRFRSLFEHLPIAYQSLDIEGRWLDANQKTADLLEFGSPEAMLGKDFIDYWDDSLKDQFDCNYDEFKRKHAIEGELLLHRTDGRLMTVQIAGRIQRDAAGKFLRTHCILIDMTERRAMEDQILTLNADLEQKVEQRTEQLKAANAAKSQFLASMSHEIRTPMNAVLGLAQLLEDEPLSEDQLQMVQRINSAGRSLLGIINDILDFSKIEAGQLSVEQRPFKLTELLSHIDSLMGPVAQNKGLALRLEENAPIAGRLSGDALRIEQILMNLVGNALKFTEQGGVTIRVAPVTVTEITARLRFEIQDTGIGLSPEAVTKLFTPFTQADSGITRRFGGTGLGLSISKRLVELMGGEIGVESTPGVGSTFWFELPFERLADEEKTATGAFEVKGPRLQGLRLLVVDDSQLNLYLAERVLQREGAEVTLMNDGQQALDCLRANPQGFDLVLMDIMMPVMDGLAATRAIREEPQLKQLPVIALTAGVLAEEKHSALEAGVNDFLPKPMDMDLMASMIRSYCPASA